MKELETVKEYLKVYLSDRERFFQEKPEEICVQETIRSGEFKYWLIRIVHKGEDFNFFSVWTREGDSNIVIRSYFHAFADVLKSGSEVQFIAPRYFFC